MADELIIDANRCAFRELFSKLKQKEKMLTYNELFKFLEKAHIFPDLLDIYRLKSLILDSAKTNGNYDKRPSFSYMGFEILLCELANKIYEKHPQNERFKLLIRHIVISCRLLYGVHLTQTLSQDPLDTFNSESTNSLFFATEDKRLAKAQSLKGLTSPFQAFKNSRDNSFKNITNKLPIANPEKNIKPAVKNDSTVNILLKTKRPVLQTAHQSPNKISPEVIGKLIGSKSLTVSPLAASEIPSPQTPNQNSDDMSLSFDDRYEKIVELFSEFKKKNESLKLPKTGCISSKVLEFISHIRNRRVGTKYLLKMNFELWKLKTLRKKLN
ncbi:unnamed protein product [Blepharisma stoltei]|uniref:Uncharacterized protein n=1 Tax=Blepharisma stoltei TaxID=1481888 RepID=A0AAU9IIE3_9CILI|nr:unnamed protein product [Blepharisma stoltei]